MKLILITLVLNISCIKEQSYKIAPYYDDITINSRNSDPNLDFTSQYKILKWYKGIENQNIQTIEYSFKDMTVRGLMIRPQNFDENKNYPVIYAHRGGFKNYKDLSLYFIKRYLPIAEMGYIIISTSFPKDKYGVMIDDFVGKESKVVDYFINMLKDLKYLDYNKLLSMSFNSRAGLSNYYLMSSNDSIRAGVIVNGASDAFLLKKERPKGFLENLHEKDLKLKNVVHFDSITKPLLIIHDKNGNISIDHAKNAFKVIEKNNKKSKLISINNKLTLNEFKKIFNLWVSKIEI